MDKSKRGQAITFLAVLALGWGWYKHIATNPKESSEPTVQTLREQQTQTNVAPAAMSTNPSPAGAAALETKQPPTTSATFAKSRTALPPTISEALSLIDRGLTTDGVALLEELSALEPNNTEVLMELAMAYSLDLKDPVKARTALEKIIDINPNYRAALNELELVYGELGAFEQGLAFLYLKIQQDPDATELQFLYGRMLASTDPKAAISWLKNATKIVDIREDALHQLAMAALSAGQIQLAITSWSEALTMAEDALSQALVKGDSGIDFLEDRIASTKIDLEKARIQAKKNL